MPGEEIQQGHPPSDSLPSKEGGEFIKFMCRVMG